MNESLTIKEKIGQRFVVGINNNNIDDIIYLIREYAVGGVVLYKKNYNSYEDMLSVIKKLKLANKNNKIPLFIAIDQEGGRVNRLPREIVNLKNMYDISKTSKSLVYDGAKVLGKILRNSGINMNLAPVMDISNNSKSKNFYKRCFAGDINDVEECGKYYIKAMKEEKIIAIGKHFPGHGVTKIDSHLFLPYIFNYKEVLNKHIKPFYNNIDMDGLMVGHLIIRKLTGLLPASISKKFIKKYLRNNYNGIVMTDEIKMLSKNIFYRYNYLKKAIVAGNDIVLIKIKNLNDGICIMDRVNKLHFNEKMLDECAKRIIELKRKYSISDDINFNGVNIDKINTEVMKINEKVNIK